MPGTMSSVHLVVGAWDISFAIRKIENIFEDISERSAIKMPQKIIGFWLKVTAGAGTYQFLHISLSSMSSMMDADGVFALFNGANSF